MTRSLFGALSGARWRFAWGLVSLVACFVCTTTLQAVTLNTRGLGQVLIFPYYTANAGFGTLLSIVNTTLHGKALKVRFHEGYNGRIVGAFNVYLSPLDVWVGQVFATGTSDDSGAALATNDQSCTAPAFLAPVDPGSGPARINFDPASYTGVNADDGPLTAARTREGYFDVIEMGEVTNATHNTLTAITHGSTGVPSSCPQITAAWETTAGYWTQDPSLDLAPPTGGLYGAASIINVASGLMYTVNASAIDGFSTAVQHTAPYVSTPDLNTATANMGNTFAAFVALGGKLVELDFSRPEDAISALFMVDNLLNEYVVDPDIGAQSDWVVTLPTKRFYTDSALLGAGVPARAPFDETFGATSAGMSCAPFSLQIFSREEQTPGSCAVLCGEVPSPALCRASNSIPIGSAHSTLGSQLLSATGAYPGYVDLAQLGFKSGWLRVVTNIDSTGAVEFKHRLTSTNGAALLGLPALGFLALDYVNGNVTPGTLANYSGAYRHRATVNCTKTANGAVVSCGD